MPEILKYKRRLVNGTIQVVSAVQYRGAGTYTRHEADDLISWINDNGGNAEWMESPVIRENTRPSGIYMTWVGGLQSVTPGSWVILDERGRVYPISDRTMQIDFKLKEDQDV